MIDGRPSPPEIPASVVVAPSITKLPSDVAGRIVLTGSHGGLYTGRLAAARKLGGVVFHDAGGGLAAAGTAGLAFLAEIGVPAVAVGHLSARIGDPEDMLRRGVVSTVNEPAAARGLSVGDGVAHALAVLHRSPGQSGASVAMPTEDRFVINAGAGPALVLADSASLVDPSRDAGSVVVTGSHGGLVGGDAALAVRAVCLAAVFNDAGVGVDEAGIGRLPVLEARGIAGITVSHTSARIGDAVSTLAGIVSACNGVAAGRGVAPGDRLATHVLAWCASPDARTPFARRG